MFIFYPGLPQSCINIPICKCCYCALLPSQNNVLELWSLFDFLMTGFLGTERQFYERFGKPILLSRDAKSSSKEQEAGWSSSQLK